MDITKSVLIMMTTYNGERFLREQLDSILGQTYPNFRLVIQDDGSTDGTEEILAGYAERDDRISLRKNEGPHGAYCNFHGLMNAVRQEEPADYYMFSDQDDIWLPDKISFYVRAAESQSPDVPALFYSDVWIVDGEGRKTGKSLNDLLGITYNNRWSLFYQVNTYGCTFFFNRKLLVTVPPLDTEDPMTGRMPHDAYLAKFAAMLGKLHYVPQKLMLYRRYGGNVTSNQTFAISFHKVAERLLDFEKLAHDHAPTYTQSLFTIEKMEPLLPEKDRQTVREIRDSILKGGFPALAVYLKYKIGVGKRARTVSKALVLLFGRYRKYLDGRVLP
ncbi:MAG: glycosyltransferase family 2 protein [Lachnospiraceae bacterium]|nr:glycosyltransferase family 2 protein [Lachnospiraceae bacterium]